MKLVRQPEGSALCGQCCVAMVASVSLKRAINVVGHEHYRGTYTREIISALATLGVPCAAQLKRISHKRPLVPKRAILALKRPKGDRLRRDRHHWLLAWDGQILDPEGCWPNAYRDWKITSYLEILT